MVSWQDKFVEEKDAPKLSWESKFVADEDPAYLKDSSLLESGARYLPDFAERGALNVAQQFNMVSPDSQDIKDISRIERRLQQIPMSTEDQVSLQKIKEAKGFLPSAKELGSQAIQNPHMIGSMIGEGIVSSAPQIAATGAGATIGAAATGPFAPVGALVGGIAGGSGVAGGQEYLSSLKEFLQQKGVDVADEQALSAAFSNKDLMDEAKLYAAKRGAIMGGANALSMGMAGKFSGPARGVIGNLAREGAAQAAIQGAGEAGAEYASTGEVNPGQTLLAGATGAITQAPEAIMAAKLRGREGDVTPEIPTERAIVDEEKPQLALPAPTADELRRGSPEAIIVNPEGEAMPGRITDSGERYYAPDEETLRAPSPAQAEKEAQVALGDNVAQVVESIAPKQKKWGDKKIDLQKAAIEPEHIKALEVSGYAKDGEMTQPQYEKYKADKAVVGQSVQPEIALTRRIENLEATAKSRESAGYPEEAAAYRAKAIELRQKTEPTVTQSYKPTEQFTAAQSEIKPKVIAALQKMNPGVKVETTAQLFGEGNNLKRSGAMSDQQQPVAGGYDALNNIAKISLDQRYDPMDTAFHEGWHSLEPHFSEPDRKILLDAYPAQGNVDHSERAATAFADWANKPLSAPMGVRPVFSRIKSTLSQIGNALRGKGFNSVDKIFEKAKSGKVAEEAGIKPLDEATDSAVAKDTLDRTKYSFGADPVGSISKATGLDAQKSKTLLERIREQQRYMDDTEQGKTPEGKALKDLPGSLKSFGMEVWQGHNRIIGSITGWLDVIHLKTGSKAVADIRDMLSRQAGSGKYVAETLQAESIRLAQTAKYKTDKVIKPFFKNPQAMKAIVYLVNNREQINLRSGSGIDRAAQAIADTLDDFSKKMKEAGLDVGHTKNYFPDSYDEHKIMWNSDKFISAATEAYKAQAKSEGLKISDHDAQGAAEAWLKAIQRSDEEASISTKVKGSPAFSKSRVFGPEARAIMNDFLVKDPISALHNYYDKASNLISYEKRFSQDKLDALVKRMKAEGVSDLDRQKVLTAIKSATGRYGNDVGALGRTILMGARYVNTLITLPKVAISSVMESVMAGVHTGNVKDSFNAMYHTMKFLFSNSKDTQTLKDNIAMVSGVINDMGTEMMMNGRYDLMGQSSHRLNRRMQRFFELSGLEKMDKASRLASAVIYQNYMYRLGKQFKSGSKFAADELRDHGVHPDSLERFSDYVTKHKEEGTSFDPKERDLNEMYADGMRTFVDRSVQQVKRAERPVGANHPIGGLFYMLQGYNNGFTQNVLLRTGRMAKRGVFGSGYSAADRLHLLAPAVMLGTMFAASQAALMGAKKMVYYNPDASDKNKGMESFYQYLNQAGFSGNYSMILNTINSVNYGHDATSALSGPILGNFGNLAGSAIHAATNKSKTNTSARHFVGDMYTDVVQPALINQVVRSVPGSLVPAVLMQAVAHPIVKSAVVSVLAGKKAR